MFQLEKLNLSAADLQSVSASEGSTSLGSPSNGKEIGGDEFEDDSMDIDESINEATSGMTKHEAMQQLILKHYFRSQVLQ